MNFVAKLSAANGWAQVFAAPIGASFVPATKAPSTLR